MAATIRPGSDADEILPTFFSLPSEQLQYLLFELPRPMNPKSVHRRRRHYNAKSVYSLTANFYNIQEQYLDWSFICGIEEGRDELDHKKPGIGMC